MLKNLDLSVASVIRRSLISSYIHSAWLKGTPPKPFLGFEFPWASGLPMGMKVPFQRYIHSKWVMRGFRRRVNAWSGQLRTFAK